MSKYYEKIVVGKKEIYIFKSHHYALLPWSIIRSKMEVAPLLVSFDYHTDTHSPFLDYASRKIFGEYCANTSEEKVSERDELVKSLIKSISYQNQDTIIKAITCLKNDEHILTAIESDIISTAFIVSYSNTSDFPPSNEEKDRIDHYLEIMLNRIENDKPHPKELYMRPYNYPKSKYYIPDIYPAYIDFGIEDGDELLEHLHKTSLEDIFIEDKLKVFSEMSNSNFDNLLPIYPYVLDIDLDYFTTFESIQPKSKEYISKIINNAVAITIAEEPDCVEMLRRNKNDSKFNSSYLRDELLKLISDAIET